MASTAFSSTRSRVRLRGEDNFLLPFRQGKSRGCPSLSSGPLHHPGRRSILPQLFSHKAHVRIDVMEEVLVAGAQIVEPILARCCLSEAVLGALSVASEAHIAFSAIFGKSSFLRIAKSRLLRRAYEPRQRRLHDISKLVVWIYEVITGIQVAVVFG